MVFNPNPLERIELLKRHIHMAVDFRGVDMNMGYNRPQLKAVAAGQYAGTWVLASCGLEHMVWEATVLIETAKHKMAAPFRLETSGK